MNADPRDVIMERIRYCLDHDNPEGTTLVSWMADEIIASPAWQAAQGERAGLTDIQADSAYANGMQVVLAAWAQCLTDETPDAFRKMQTILETRRAVIIEARLTGAKP